MMRWVSSLLLILCLWNSTAAAMPSFAELLEDTHTVSLEDTHCTQLAASTEVTQVESRADDCHSDGGEHDHCDLHRCHLGHCTFLPMSIAALDSRSFAQSQFPSASLFPYSISLSGPRRPPRA